MRTIRTAIIVFAILLTAVASRSQTQTDDNSDFASDDQQLSILQDSQTPGSSPDGSPVELPLPINDGKKKPTESEPQQSKRMFWLIPNFGAVNANIQLPPLTPRQKFVLASHDSFLDYSGFTWTAILAGQAMALNSDPELGHGAAAYGRYYWRNFVDGISGTFFTEAIVPVMTHEDPRYFTFGHGGFFRRTAYAISRAFVCKSDSGATVFNWSEVAGNGLEAAVSNAYYPPQERGLNETARNWGTQMESAVLNHIFQEFWPDIRRGLFRRK